MNKLFTKIATAFVGIAMAVGVGVAVGSHSDVKASHALTNTYTKVRSISDLSTGDNVVLAQMANNSPSSGISSTSSITTSTTESEWIVYSVTKSSNTFTLKSGNVYVTATGSNGATFGHGASGASLHVGNGTGSTTGVLYNSSNRFLGKNGNNIKFYATSNLSSYPNYYVWKVSASCEHTYGDWVVTKAATCTEAGSHKKTCSKCGNELVEAIPALGHSWGSGTIHEATCTEGGYTDYECSTCHEHKHEDESSALGHNYVNGICTRCGAAEPSSLDAVFGTTSGGDSSSGTAITSGTALKENYHYTIDSNLTFSGLDRVYPQDSKTLKLGASGGGATFTVSIPTQISSKDVEIESVSLTTKIYGSDNVTVTVTANSVSQGSFSTSSDSSFTKHDVTFSTTGQTSFTVTSTKRYYLQKLTVNYKTTGSTYTVTYNANGATGGDVPTDGTAYSSGATVTVKANTGSLVKTDYTFTGWNTQNDGEGTHYAASGSATFTISSDVTLYAEWSKSLDAITAIGGTVTASISDAGSIDWDYSNLTVTGTLSGSTGQNVKAYVDLSSSTTIPSTAGSCTVSVTATKKSTIPGSATPLTNNSVSGEVEAQKLVYTFTMSYSDLTKNSYGDEDNAIKTSKATCTNHDSIDISWRTSNVIKNNTSGTLSMQFKGSPVGYLYNTTEIPGTITGISYNDTVLQGSFTNYYGNSVHPTESTTVGGKYFSIVSSSGTDKVQNITVTFEVYDKPKVQLTASNMNLDVADGVATPTITDGTSAVTGYSLTSEDSYIASITNDNRVQPTGYGKVTISVTKEEDAGHIYLATTFTVTVGDHSKEASIMEFTEKCNGSATAADGVEWTIEANASENAFSEVFGINYGSNNDKVSSLTLTTPADEERIIKNVVVEAMSNTEGSDISVQVGSSSFTCSKSTSLVGAVTTYNFSGNTSGAITISISGTQSSSKYGVKSIAVLYVGDEATSFASTFLSAISCTQAGTSKPTFNFKEGDTRWTWALLKSEFDNLSATDQAKFAKNAEGVSATITECVARYDYIVGKYYVGGVDPVLISSDFMNRSPSPVGNGRIMLNVISTQTTNTSIIVIVTVGIAAIAIGGYFLLRKKKED